MRYGLHVPNLGRYADPMLVLRLARTAEVSGWDGFFLWDHLALSANRAVPVIDPWITLAAVASHTERMILGPLVTPLARRRPWKVARESVTLDHLAGGRTVLGVGLGEPADAEFGAFGEPTDGRIRAELLDESLEVLEALWSGEPVRHTGQHYGVDSMAFLPPPLQSRIPVWVAAKWPGRRPVRRAARWDAVVAMKAGEDFHRTLEPVEVAAITDAISAQRDRTDSFDTVVSATSSWSGSPVPANLGEYLQAGASWWLEVVHPFDSDPESIERLISNGPGVLQEPR